MPDSKSIDPNIFSDGDQAKFLQSDEQRAELTRSESIIGAEDIEEGKLDYEIAMASKDDPEYLTAISVILKGEETEEQIKAMIEKSAPYSYWWTQDEWKGKGDPLEVIKLELKSEKQVEIYNWLRTLTPEEQVTLQKVVDKFSNLANGKALETLRYILITDKPLKTTLATGEDVNGAGTLLPADSSLNGIQLYPNAMIGEHRTGGVSNFEGTLMHEMSHHLVDRLRREWINRFGWKPVENYKHICTEEERCISDYAKTSPEEDICDSITALLSNNHQLDPEKAEFLTQELLNSQEEDAVTNSELLQGENARLPQLKKVYYRKSGITIF